MRVLADPYRPLQQRMWVVERIGWALLTLVLLWALAGGAGSGPLASQRLEGEYVSLSYDRFARRGAASEMNLAWKSTPQSHLLVSLDGGFIDAMKIDFAARGIAPMRSGSRVLLRIPTAGGEGSLAFDAHPLRAGRKSSTLQIDGVEIGAVSVLVFP